MWLGKETVGIIIRFGRKQARAISSKLFGHIGGTFLSPRKAKALKPCSEQEYSGPLGAWKKLQAKESCMLHQVRTGNRHSYKPWASSYPCPASVEF